MSNTTGVLLEAWTTYQRHGLLTLREYLGSSRSWAETVLVVFSVFWVVFCYLFSVFFCLRPASCMLNIPSVSRLSIIAPSLYTKVYLNTDGQQQICSKFQHTLPFALSLKFKCIINMIQVHGMCDELINHYFLSHVLLDHLRNLFRTSEI